MKRPVFNPKDIGEAIRRRRRQAGWSQKRLAEEAGLDPTSISKYESGTIRIGKNNLKKICSAFGCAPEQILAETWDISEKELNPGSDHKEKARAVASGFPQAELERIYDESVAEVKKSYLKACRALFEALHNRGRAE